MWSFILTVMLGTAMSPARPPVIEVEVRGFATRGQCEVARAAVEVRHAPYGWASNACQGPS